MSNPPPYPAIHYTDLHTLGWERIHGPEWLTYCREVGRLLEEGHEGHYALISGSEVLHVCDTIYEAQREFIRLYESVRPTPRLFLIQEWTPFGRVTPLVKLCRDTSSALPATG